MDQAGEGDSEDEYRDIDWDAVDTEVAAPQAAPDDVEESDAIGGVEAQSPAAAHSAAPLSASHSAEVRALAEPSKPHTAEEKEAAEARRAEAAELRRRRAALRRRAAERHRVLALCFAARLRALSTACDDMLVQAMALSAPPRRTEGDGRAAGRDTCTKPGLRPPPEFAEESAHLGDCSVSAPPCGMPPTYALLAAAARGPASSEEAALLRVACCRAEGTLARVVMDMPLPAAKACASLLEGVRLPAPQLWAEVFHKESGLWLADPPVQSPLARGARTVPEKLWVIASGEGGVVRDVTRRYAGRWSFVCSSRGSLAKHFDDMIGRLANWSEARAPMPACIAASLDVARADLMDEERLAARAKREPIPTSRAAFKRHASYILDSQLRPQDIVHPESARPVGLFRGQEKVWRRTDIVELRTPTQWRREGRLVRDDERPHKTMRMGTSNIVCKLFGPWQTEEAPDLIVDVAAEEQGSGPIPGVNNYGNFELFDSGAVSRLPLGTLYVQDNAARSAAARLGIYFAPAVVGFQLQAGAQKPKFGGVVVWQRDVEELCRCIAEEKARQAELEERRRQERFQTAWRLLVKNVLVDDYVEQRYRSSSGAGSAAEAPIDVDALDMGSVAHPALFDV